MPRGVRKQVPTEQEIEPVLPNKQQAQKPLPMQGLRRLQQARRQSGMGNTMNNLLGLKARMSPYGNSNNA